MDLPSRTVRVSPQSIASNIRGDWIVETQNECDFCASQPTPRHFDRMLTCILKLGALGARGEGQKPTHMMHYFVIEAESFVVNQVANAKTDGK